MREHGEKQSVCVCVCACGTWRALDLSAHRHSRLCADTKEQYVKLAPPASPLHRRSLFNFDNQNIRQLEILVIWFSLVSSWEMKALRSLLKKNLDFWRWDLTRSMEPSLCRHWPKLTTSPGVVPGTQTHAREESSSFTVFIYFIIFFLNVTRAQVKTRHEFESAVNKADGADPFTFQNYFVPSSNGPNAMGPRPVIFPLL